jgi:SAM-dependent methyltransferase
MSQFSDHFSARAAEYARFRPRYPGILFEYLASLVPGASAAWDCATGSGQAAVALAEYVPCVIATDASVEQIAHATLHPRVEYRVALAERSGLPDDSVDIVTVAQALHWFRLPAFFAEVGRVLRPGGVLAVWSYARLELPGEARQRILDRFYAETLGAYWPPERQLVEEGYRAIDLPFPAIEPPAFAMQAEMTLESLIGYLSTWSAPQRYVGATGEDPLPALRQELVEYWEDPALRLTVRWPLALRIVRRPAPR